MIKPKTFPLRLAPMLLLLLVGLLLGGCLGRDGTGAGEDPVIDTIYPLKGPPGAVITIRGSGFVAGEGGTVVRINGDRAPVVDVTATRVQAAIPEGATTGPVEVSASGSTASGPVFFVGPGLPGMQSIVPASARFGERVTLKGLNFGSDPAEVSVAFGAVPAVIEEVSDLQLVVRVPKGAESGPVKLQVGTQRIDGLDFTYLQTVRVTTWAGGAEGFADGDSTGARFAFPGGLDVTLNNTLFIADQGNHSIRQITSDRRVTTLAGTGQAGFRNGSADSAQFRDPLDVAVGPQGDLLVTDVANNAIRLIRRNVNLGIFVSTYAGGFKAGDANGTGGNAELFYPAGITTHPSGLIYLTDYINQKIKSINSRGFVTTAAGLPFRGYEDGDAFRARFHRPFFLAPGPRGLLYITDYLNNRIRTFDPVALRVGTLAGHGEFGYAEGPAGEAQFNRPAGIAVASDGTVYVADEFNHAIRVITPEGTVRTLAGDGTPGSLDGTGQQARFNRPIGLVLAADGSLFVCDTFNHRIRHITLE